MFALPFQIWNQGNQNMPAELQLEVCRQIPFQVTAPDLMMKLVFNLRYNLHIYWRWRFGIMMQSRLRPQWQELEPWVLFYPKVDSLLPGNVYHN